MQSETEVYQQMLCGYIGQMAHWLKQIPEEKWDWTPGPGAPSVRQVAEHALVWLVCDRQHVSEPDIALHTPVPDPPREPAAFCAALEAEGKWWREWLGQQNPESYLQPRKQFGISPMNVRGFVFHITQQIVYKVGQLSTLYYALGMDGIDPYTAPQPNVYYGHRRQWLEIPLFAAILREDVAATEAVLTTGADPNSPSPDGILPLEMAVQLNNMNLIETLVSHGADPFLPCSEGYSAHQIAVWKKDAALLALFGDKPETTTEQV